jgi:phospholipase/carboxylesterase
LPSTLSIRFIFPHAPMMPVTINNGYVMRAWYDILAMDIGSEQDEAGIRASQQSLERLIEAQISDGIRSERIVLAGFSQGGAIILQTGLRFDRPLAGLMALSTYLPLATSLQAEHSDCNRATPIFMGHGDSDPVVRPELAYRSRSRLEQQGYTLEWHEYPGMEHSVCMEEIGHISQWLKQRLV